MTLGILCGDFVVDAPRSYLLVPQGMAASFLYFVESSERATQGEGGRGRASGESQVRQPWN